MPDADKPAGAPEAKTPPPAAKADPQESHLLLKQHGDIPAGRIVRGAQSEIRALGSGVSRPATPQDLAIAGGRTVRLPRKR